MHGMVTRKTGRNVMHSLFFFFRLIKTSFRCGHEPQMDFLATGYKYLNLSKFPERVWSG